MAIKNNNLGLKILYILCYITVGLYAFTFIMTVFNIAGVSDSVQKILIEQLNYTAEEASTQITLLSIEMVIGFFYALYCAKFYHMGYKFARNDKFFGNRVITMGIFQILFGLYFTGIFAIVVGIVMGKKKQSKVEIKSDGVIPQQKLELMGEAVERLKKLREIGAISEEEYYINLNKILEG
ncbi:MAG: hypothetical protein E7345_04865 [Clostridiales bacterium]|nr:hypothetical protein [Clostridiales bacterium]